MVAEMSEDTIAATESLTEVVREAILLVTDMREAQEEMAAGMRDATRGAQEETIEGLLAPEETNATETVEIVDTKRLYLLGSSIPVQHAHCQYLKKNRPTTSLLPRTHTHHPLHKSKRYVRQSVQQIMHNSNL